jgi:peptidoglycan/xylan/chitin deacetylase (PgdA/CDA1 family)
MGGFVRVAGCLAAVSLLAGIAQPPMAAPIDRPAPPAVAAGPTHPVLPVRSPAVAEPTPVSDPKPDPKPEPAPDCAKLKCVALTFDDGPVPGTANVLALLRRNHVHATFFVTGVNAKAHPKLLRRMVADGNVIGNHSWNHPEFWKLSRAKIRNQLAHTDAVIRRATGKRPTLLRPPFGEVDAKVRALAKARGQAIVLWDVDPRDWKDRAAKTVAKRVLKQVRRGSIVLVHDVWPSTRHAVGTIIHRLRARGYTLVTVPQLLGGKQRPGRVYLRR